MNNLREQIIIALEDELCSTEATFGGVADRIIAMLQEQEPVAWVHPTNLVNPALGIMCSPMQLGSGQIPLHTAPMPPSVPSKLLPVGPDVGDMRAYAEGWNDCIETMKKLTLAAAPKPGDGT